MSKVTDILDRSDTAAAAAKAQPALALQTVQVLLNQQVVAAGFGTLTAALDTDALQNSDYASVAGTATLATVVTKFNAVLVRLDDDTSVTDTNYEELLTIRANDELSAKFVALLAKLDADAGVTATTYRSGLAAYTAALMTQLNG